MLGSVRDENFVVEHGWMINRFGLKGNDLRIYAIIYGFSQTSDQWFTGGLQYLADWVCGTKQGVIKNLKTLLEMGLIQKRETTINGVKACSYRATQFNGVKQSLTGHETEFNGGIKQSLTGCSTELNGGVKQSLPNNISIKDTDIDIDKKEGAAAPGPLPASEKKTAKKPKIDTEAILQRYTQDAKALELLREWLKVRKAKRAPETEKALTLNLDKLDSLAKESGLSVPGYLEAVIARGWAAFYPIRENAQAPRAARSHIRTEQEHNAGQHASGFGWG